MFSAITVTVLFLAAGRCQSEEGQIPVKVVENNETDSTQDASSSDYQEPLISNITYITVGPTNQPKTSTELPKDTTDETTTPEAEVSAKDRFLIENDDNNTDDRAEQKNGDRNTDETESESYEDNKTASEEPITSTIVTETEPTVNNNLTTESTTDFRAVKNRYAVPKKPDIEIIEKDLYEGNENGFNASHNMEVRAQATHPITIGLEKNSSDGPFTLNIAVPKDIRNANIVIQIPLNVNVKATDKIVDNNSGIKLKVDEAPKYKEDINVNSVNSGKEDEDSDSRERGSSKILTGSVLHGKQKLTDVQIANIIKEKIKKSKAAAEADLQAKMNFNVPKKRPETLFFKIQ